MNTQYWVNRMMKMVFGGSGEFYLGLSSTSPSSDGTGITEPSSGGYARARIDKFTEPANGEVKNAGMILFPQSTGEWFTSANKATHWVLFDGDGSSANVLAGGALSEPIIVSIDTTVKIPAESLSITLTDAS